MKLGLFALTMTMVAAPALAAFNPSSLPQTCKDTLAQMQQDKARFTALGKEMQKFRKASDTPNFCTAARQVVIIIKTQSDKLDECVGELANDKTASPDASNQMIQLRGVYKQMLDAAKDEKNDQLKCGLADQ